MNPAADKFTVERITEVRAWTPSLFSFKTTRHRGFRFVAGQFARLGVRNEEGGIVWRAYSIVSAPYDEHLEFYSIVVPGGEFMSRLARLKTDDEILVEKMNYGYLTTDRFQAGRDLWIGCSPPAKSRRARIGAGFRSFLGLICSH